MVTWPATAAVVNQFKIFLLTVFIVIEQLTPDRGSPVAADGQCMGTVVQPAHHVHVDHEIHFFQI
jgi:hypothetical protein